MKGWSIFFVWKSRPHFTLINKLYLEKVAHMQLSNHYAPSELLPLTSQVTDALIN